MTKFPQIKAFRNKRGRLAKQFVELVYQVQKRFNKSEGFMKFRKDETAEKREEKTEREKGRQEVMMSFRATCFRDNDKTISLNLIQKNACIAKVFSPSFRPLPAATRRY